MATFSWQIVENNGGVVTSGTSTVPDTVTTEDMARTIHDRHPHAVQVAVWAGEHTDRPKNVRWVA